MQARRQLRSVLLLVGSFTFAFLLGEAVHEFGHWLAHQAYGHAGIGIHLDPFGGSHITGVNSLPRTAMGVTSAAGPLLNLLVGLVVSAALFRRCSPVWLPLCIWGPVALIQEGVTFSLGLLTPGGDAEWVAATLGIPEGVILAFGIVLLLAGLAGVSSVLPSAGLAPDASFGRRLVIVLGGFGFLMLVRSAYAFVSAPDLVVENLVPLIFAALLSVLLAGLSRPLAKILGVRQGIRAHNVSWRAVLLALNMGAGMFLLQLLVP